MDPYAALRSTDKLMLRTVHRSLLNGACPKGRSASSWDESPGVVRHTQEGE